jgi:hypothetical protein
VEQRLRALHGLEVFRPAPTSVAALLSSGHGRRLLVLRADLDALPVQEATGAEYASQRAGFMHGCGHDGHTAAVLTTAHVLMEVLGEVRRPVLFLFQQAEERHPSGAPLALRGITERLGDRITDAEVFGFHLWPNLPQGTIGVRAGPLMGSVAGLTGVALDQPEREHQFNPGQRNAILRVPARPRPAPTGSFGGPDGCSDSGRLTGRTSHPSDHRPPPAPRPPATRGPRAAGRASVGQQRHDRPHAPRRPDHWHHDRRHRGRSASGTVTVTVSRRSGPSDAPVP